ncbi:hypothetical protein tloyanaT_15810 [Thalassotalea loyana]|uniref:Uncharacterized protein n=1 Tax=Thalassotalea loyana TaxID=280483 RepID=A0ABQ6HCQ4_9GAMM|nr:hypothetical protein [Thalassotalea loyana]GLX85329.1 hypothetical protein tloyanaT_15810 [Thalassotalea loyana]
MSKTEKEIEELLDKVCVDLGFCLTHSVKSRLIKFPPKTPEKFTKAVVEAEGFTLDTINKPLYQQLFEQIDRVYSKYT